MGRVGDDLGRIAAWCDVRRHRLTPEPLPRIFAPPENPMSQICMVTGKGPLVGNNVSHSHIRTKKRTAPNLHWKRFWVPAENRWVRLRVSAHGLRIIDKRGIESVLADVRSRGIKVR